MATVAFRWQRALRAGSDLAAALLLAPSALHVHIFAVVLGFSNAGADFLLLCVFLSMQGSYSSHHLHLSPMPPPGQPLTSPALAAQQRQVSTPPVGGPSQSLTKANLLSPGRRASMVSHSPSTSGTPASPGAGVASLSIGGGGPGMSRLTIVRAPSMSGGSRDRSGSSSHGSDHGGHRR